MSLLTDFLKLFKWDTTSETDLDEEFDIDTSMNGNWDILDTKAKNHEDRINTLEAVQIEQDSLIQKLKDNMINLTTEEDTSLYITDAGTPPASLKVRGNHKQDGTPTLENPSEIETVKDEVNVIVSNKNLYKITASNKTDAGVTFTVNEDGTVVANGTSTGTYLNLGEIYLDAGTYTVSGGPANGDWNKQRLTLYLYKGPTENYSIYRNMTYTFTLTERTRVSLAYVAQSGSVLNNEVIKPMIEYGTVATDFIKHEEIKKTLDIQQEMLEGDYFDLENDKENHGYEKKNMSEIDWVVSSNQLQEKTYCFMVMYSVAGLSSTEINCFSNCFKSLTGSYLFANDEEGIAQSQSQILCRISKEKVADLNAFKALLAEKNAVVYVKSPTQLDLTETQKQQLTQLDNLDLFKGINNIYTEEGIALIQLDYSADTKQTVDSLNDRITALEQQLLNTAGSEG